MLAFYLKYDEQNKGEKWQIAPTASYKSAKIFSPESEVSWISLNSKNSTFS
jgi:hypothetical protein